MPLLGENRLNYSGDCPIISRKSRGRAYLFVAGEGQGSMGYFLDLSVTFELGGFISSRSTNETRDQSFSFFFYSLWTFRLPARLPDMTQTRPLPLNRTLSPARREMECGVIIAACSSIRSRRIDGRVAHFRFLLSTFNTCVGLLTTCS